MLTVPRVVAVATLGRGYTLDRKLVPTVHPTIYAALQADHGCNDTLKQLFEHELRILESRKRLKRGAVARLIAAAP